jgi:hypothetical protein
MVVKVQLSAKDRHSAPGQFHALKRSAEPAVDLATRIDRLYDQIIAWTQEPSAAERGGEIEKAWLQLRKLQEAEAVQFRERFEASLAMPMDAGSNLRARARSLRSELEDLATAHPASRRPDPT